MLKVAIVGCGKIADQHLVHIRTIPGCRIVAVCDREDLMAAQLQHRSGATARYVDVEELLDRENPDVVHITTPPQSHYAIARMCLMHGSHVYVEKPFTLTAAEAEDLLSLAEQKQSKLTVGHDAQFSHAAITMRSLVAQGYLGGDPVHIESYYCYDLSDANYAKALLGDSYHWVRGLPGGLLQNTISHGISKIAEYISGDDPGVIAYGFTSKVLRNIGETGITDELRTIVHDGDITAYFTFSSQMRPPLHMLRLYGPRNSLILDEVQQTVIKVPGNRKKSYLEMFLPQWNIAGQYAGASLGNMKKFARADFHMEYGKRTLIREFYRSITDDLPVPISHSQILRTSRIMDQIFAQLHSPQQAARALVKAHDSRKAAVA